MYSMYMYAHVVCTCIWYMYEPYAHVQVRTATNDVTQKHVGIRGNSVLLTYATYL